MKNHIPSFNSFVNESMNEAMSFDEIKDKYLDNPYGIGADAIEFIDSERGNSRKLIFRHGDKLRRDQIEKNLKTFGIPAKKMSKSMQDKAYKHRFELHLYESINEESMNEAEKIEVGIFVRYKKDKDFTGGKIKSIKGSNAEIHNWDGSTTELPLKDLEYVKSWNESINESVINEADIKSEAEFKEYAEKVLRKAHKDDYDEAKAEETIDGILKKSKGDMGAAVGMLTSGLS